VNIHRTPRLFAALCLPLLLAACEAPAASTDAVTAEAQEAVQAQVDANAQALDDLTAALEALTAARATDAEALAAVEATAAANALGVATNGDAIAASQGDIAQNGDAIADNLLRIEDKSLALDVLSEEVDTIQTDYLTSAALEGYATELRVSEQVDEIAGRIEATETALADVQTITWMTSGPLPVAYARHDMPEADGDWFVNPLPTELDASTEAVYLQVEITAEQGSEGDDFWIGLWTNVAPDLEPTCHGVLTQEESNPDTAICHVWLPVDMASPELTYRVYGLDGDSESATVEITVLGAISR